MLGSARHFSRTNPHVVLSMCSWLSYNTIINYTIATHTHTNTNKDIHDKFPIHTVLGKYLRSLPTLTSTWGSLQSHVMRFRLCSCTAHSGYEYGVDAVKYPLHLPWHFKVLLRWHGAAYGHGIMLIGRFKFQYCSTHHIPCSHAVIRCYLSMKICSNTLVWWRLCNVSLHNYSR